MTETRAVGLVAAMDELILWPWISRGVPAGNIGVHKGLLVLLDVLGGWISGRVTSNRTVTAILKLPDADPAKCISTQRSFPMSRLTRITNQFSFWRGTEAGASQIRREQKRWTSRS